MISQEQVLAVFGEAGGTDLDYLEAHLPRFLNTFRRFDSRWDRRRGVRMLDIGAHWLHQAVVFALGGYQVTAADVPVTFELESVQKLADSQGIGLLSYTDLSAPGSLSAIPSDSMNVVMMAEIIEHITFNPVELWKEIHRVTVPGGRIIVTTPNYYASSGRAWAWRRFLSGFGGGIPIDDVLNINTMGHHWKEYSLRELQYYFCRLSPDFNCVNSEYTTDEMGKAGLLRKHFKWLRPGLYLEVEVVRKERGVIVTPGW